MIFTELVLAATGTIYCLGRGIKAGEINELIASDVGAPV